MPSKAGDHNVYQSSDQESPSPSQSSQALPPNKTPSPSHAARNNAGQHSGSEWEYYTRSKDRPAKRRLSKVSKPAPKRQFRKPRGSNTTQPSSNATQPSSNTTQPSSNNTQPSSNNTQPSSNTTQPSSYSPQVISLDDEIEGLVNDFIHKSSAKDCVKVSQTQSTGHKLAQLRDVDKGSEQCDGSDVAPVAGKTSTNDADTLGPKEDRRTFEGNLNPEKPFTNAGNNGAEYLALLRTVQQVQALEKNVEDITQRMSSTWLFLQKKETEMEEFRKKKESAWQQIKELEQQAKEIEDLETAAQIDISKCKTDIEEGEDNRNRYLETISRLKEEAAPQVKVFQTTIAILSLT